jgi:hypothetical protein
VHENGIAPGVRILQLVVSPGSGRGNDVAMASCRIG